MFQGVLFPDWSTSAKIVPCVCKGGSCDLWSGSQWSIVEVACYQLLDQRRHMAKQPTINITGLSDPELPCDPVVSPETHSGTSATNSESPSGKLDGPLEDSKETSGSMTSNSTVPQRYLQRSQRPPEQFETSFK